MSNLDLTLHGLKVIFARYTYLILIIPLFFIAIPMAKSGIPITGDFPYSDTPDFAIDRLWLWVDKGSIDGLESLSRFPIIAFWYLLSFVTLDSELATKIMVILGFLLASFSFYFSYNLFFKNRGISTSLQLKLSAVLGSIFYAYNIWSFNRIHHWYLWISYSILPFFFISIYLSFKNPKNLKFAVFSIFLWSFASTTPHMILFYGLIFLATFFGFILYNLNKGWRTTIQLVTPFFLIILFYSLVNMYWIYPYLLSSQAQISIVNYEVTEENLNLISREGDFLNTFRILSYWLNSIVENPLESSPLYPFWVCLSFVVPVIAFSALLLNKLRKYALVFSGIALIGIFLAMGTQSQFEYHNLLFTVPFLSKFLWLFREADKWSFLIVFAYSFLIGLVSYKILSVTIKGKLHDNKRTMVAGLFIFFLILSIFVTSYPFYKHHIGVLKPTILPTEFDKLNSFLSGINTEKIYFMPYPMEETQWDKLGRVGSIYQLSSIKPSIESSQYNLISRNYYNYLVNSILENRTKNIGNLIYPLGTSYIIFHNDTWSKIKRDYEPANIHLLEKMYSVEDLRNVTDIGFYKIFQISNYDNSTNSNNKNMPGQVKIPSQIVAGIGGLDLYNSLVKLPSFNTLQSSLLFTDDIRSSSSNPIRNVDQLVSDRPLLGNELLFSLVDEKFIVSPFVDTNRHDPSKVWSKASTRDPDHAEFHSYLTSLGIDNWEFDYGKGLVMTKAMGEKLSVPIKIEKQNKNSSSDDFSIFMRYLKNEKGGLIRVYLDDKLISNVDTFDRISNRFVWEKLGSLNLTEGRHELTLENVAGFNAVNILSVLPIEEFDKLKKDANKMLANGKQIIYYLEAESNFYNTKGEDTNSSHYLVEDDDNRYHYDNKTGTKSNTIHGSFKVPQNTDLVSLQFIHKRNDSISNLIKDIEINPTYGIYNIFNSDFERIKNSTSLAKLRQLDWMNFDKDIISTSLEMDSPIHGNKSLKVDLAESEKEGWNIISTDYIPIIDNTLYNATLDISANDVKDLHSRILYFNSNKDEMNAATDLIFEGKDGTFQEAFSSSIVPPVGAKYLQYQILTSSENSRTSSFLLDEVKLQEIDIPVPVLKTKSSHNLEQNKLPEKQQPMNGKHIDYLGSEQKINSTHHMLATKAFPVKENHVYNYSATLNDDDMPIRSVTADFRSSREVVENSTRYGSNASDGSVLSMGPGSEIETTLEILRPSNYSIALRAKTCESCGFLRMEIEGNEYQRQFTIFTNVSNSTLKHNFTGLQWLNSNTTYLKEGTYTLKIYSDSQADLDSVVIYPSNNSYNSASNGTADLFKNISSPAQISGYEKINPTKHMLSIKNATRPYIISFAETYDSLWKAYSTKNENQKSIDYATNSIPVYGLTNGFYVNKTGDYDLVIEYEPQNWFVRGAMISIGGLILLSAITIFLAKKKYFLAIYAKIRKK